jgi:hypothetical protein
VSAALCSSYFENRPPPNTARSIAPTSSQALIVSRSAPIVSATSVALNRLVLWRAISAGWIGCKMASFVVRGDSANKIGPWINIRQQTNCDDKTIRSGARRTLVKPFQSFAYLILECHPLYLPKRTFVTVTSMSEFVPTGDMRPQASGSVRFAGLGFASVASWGASLKTSLTTSIRKKPK